MVSCMKSSYTVKQGKHVENEARYDDQLWKAIDAKFDAAIALIKMLPDNVEED